MARCVKPKVFLVGTTQPDFSQIYEYLKYSGNEEFQIFIEDAVEDGLSGIEILCSMFAKLCYKSLTIGKNANLNRTRDIKDNLKSILDTAHGSIWEHVQFNFIFTDVSRVFTHELCRHRVGVAFSQTSGRYVRLDNIDLVHDPILDGCKEDILDFVRTTEQAYAKLVEKSGILEDKDFTTKKKKTSALRRIAPNGLANEIAFSVNLRSIRHIIQLRTQRHAEWEIRVVFAEVFKILNENYPLLFQDAKIEEVDGVIEVSGMKMQPYEKT